MLISKKLDSFRYYFKTMSFSGFSDHDQSVLEASGARRRQQDNLLHRASVADRPGRVGDQGSGQGKHLPVHRNGPRRKLPLRRQGDRRELDRRRRAEQAADRGEDLRRLWSVSLVLY